MPSSSSRSFWYRSTKAAPSSPGTLQTTCAVTRRGTLRWGTLIERSMGVPGGTTSAMRRESPPDPTVLVASEAISSGARMSTSSSASARRWCRRSATPPCDWMLPRSCVTSSRQRSRWPSGRRSRVARFASSRISWWRGSPGSNIVRSVPPMSDPSAILPGMLELLRVRAFAIIDELEAHFAPGFNVHTGETGAGKSILVDALHLVLGGRAQADAVRTGAERASFLRYQLDELEKADAKAGEDEALVQERRVLAAAEKLRAGADEAETLLRSGDGAAVVGASRACKRLEELAAIDPSLASVA